MWKSYVADNIMREYDKKRKYEANKYRKETEEFKRKNCINCKNKKTDLCNINRNINGELQCVFKEI